MTNTFQYIARYFTNYLTLRIAESANIVHSTLESKQYDNMKTHHQTTIPILCNVVWYNNNLLNFTFNSTITFTPIVYSSALSCSYFCSCIPFLISSQPSY